MTRITIFIRSLTRGGAEKQSLMLAKCLNPLYSVDVIIFYSQNYYTNFIKDHNINLIVLQGSLIKKLVYLYKYFKQNRDTFLFNYLPINNVLGSIIGRLAGIKHIYCGIRNADYVTQYYKLILQKYVCNHIADLIVTNSYESIKNYGEAGFNTNKMRVIHNCIKLPENPSPVRNNHFINILTVTRFIDFKDIDCSIKAVHYLVNDHPEIRNILKYQLVGYGVLENNIRHKVDSLDLNDVISIHDGNGNIGHFFQDANIYLSTSISEGLSNSIMEAMSYALPVVATNVGDNIFLVKDGINGYLCRIKDYVSIAEYLYLILNDENIHKSFSEMSLKIVKEDFSEEAFTQKYKMLIQERSSLMS